MDILSYWISEHKIRKQIDPTTNIDTNQQPKLWSFVGW